MRKLGALLLIGLLAACSSGSQAPHAYCHQVISQGKVGQKMLAVRPCP